MSIEFRNSPNNPWYYKCYKNSEEPIPIRIMSGPNTPSDITGYSFSVRGKISFDQDQASFELGNDKFEVVDAKNGLVSFTIPTDTLNALAANDYLCQVTIKDGVRTKKSQIFTIKVLESI